MAKENSSQGRRGSSGTRIEQTVQGQYFLRFKEVRLWAKLTHEKGSLGQLGPGCVGQGQGKDQETPTAGRYARAAHR